MEYELDLLDRLVIGGILPKENDIATLKIIRDLKNQIGVTEDEHKEFQLQANGQTFKWNKKGNIPKKFTIGEIAEQVIIKALKDLEAKKKLGEEMIETYEKFVNKPTPK